MYPNIDLEKTGIKLKTMIKASGYTVKYIQEYLCLACPQSIYKWFKGKALPSVENLHALSALLNVHMEDLLVFETQHLTYFPCEVISDNFTKRLLCYYNYLYKAV